MLLVISSAARIALNYYVTFTSEEWRRIISTNLMRTLGGSNVDDYKNAGKELITKVIITDTDNIMNYRIRPFLMIIAYGDYCFANLPFSTIAKYQFNFCLHFYNINFLYSYLFIN